MGLFATYDEYATYAHESFPGCTWTRVHNSEETYISVQIVGYETVVDQKEELVYRRFLFLCHGDCMMEKKMGINNDADRVEDIFDDLMWELKSDNRLNRMCKWGIDYKKDVGKRLHRDMLLRWWEARRITKVE